jgi:hypothetical protein
MKACALAITLFACNVPGRTGAQGSDAAIADTANRDAPADASVDAALDAGSAPDPLQAFLALDPNCADSWCWYWPTPTGNPYYQVYATAPDNIWITGARGTIFQWNGQVWSRHHPPPLPGEDFVQWPFQIIGTGSNDMWLILGTAIEHWNGATWTIVAAGPTNVAIYYHQLWIAPDTGDVYATSNVGLERSHNGGPFEVQLRANVVAVWGVSSTDFFLGSGGSITQFDGTTFNPVFFEQNKFTLSYQGFPNDAWASGGNATLVHWDGSTWTDVPTGLSATATITSVAALAPNDVWWLTSGNSSLGQGLLHWDGTSITATPLDTSSFGDVCCRSLNSAAIIAGRWWIVSDDGLLYTKVGANAIQPLISPPQILAQMWGTADNDMYFAMSGAIGHWNGSAMTRMPLPAATGSVTGVAGTGLGGANELFSLGYTIDYAPDPYEYVYYGSRHDGLSWSTTELLRAPAFGARMTNLYAIKSGEAMAVGTGGRAFRYHDGVWTPVTTNVTTDLVGIWGPDPDHLWISGTHGTLLMWDRANPDVVIPDPTFPATTTDLGTIHGADGLMWVANPQTFFVSMRSSTGWQQINTNVIVNGVFAVTQRNVVVTTFDNGHIARWDGTSFSVEDYGYYVALFSAFQPPGQDQHMWITNGRGGVMRHP